MQWKRHYTKEGNNKCRYAAGVDNDSVISIKGQGEPGRNGGPNGDLYVVISVEPHKPFKRKGDLWLDAITFDQAALGAEPLYRR